MSPQAVTRPPGRQRGAQPRPQFGFLPWLAFFFFLSLRFTVRFDMRRKSLDGMRQAVR